MAFETVLLDIDTQRDFLEPAGAWPIPSAIRMIPSLERLTRYAKTYRLPVVATVQVLEETDPRFQENGGTLPAHCIKGSRGQEKAFATRPENPVVIPCKPLAESEISSLVSGRREIVMETSGPDLMSNPNAGALLAGVRKAVVFGLAAEEAVLKAVQVLLNRGIAVEVVQNAIAARVAEPEALEKHLEEMVTLGARKIRDLDIMTRFTTARHH
jgi:nicotinamidase/pyrazinamidase